MNEQLRERGYNAALARARAAGATDAMRRLVGGGYARHLSSCTKSKLSAAWRPVCTCGFDDLLSNDLLNRDIATASPSVHARFWSRSTGVVFLESFLIAFGILVLIVALLFGQTHS